ncbi:hypothetical protein [Edaphobacter aggregans]|uniref:hypothetical protein n=1 Tax=Edaphobacter aggregans TaxID=570835 RepID=UPI0006913C4D|nr:hypothetical protein [Edaphobacter aggregans]
METAIDLRGRLDRRLKSGALRSKTVGTRVSETEEQELIAAANRDGRNLSEWTRDVLLQTARRSDDDAFFTELVAMRMLMLNLFKPLIMGKPVSQEWVTEVMAAIRKEKRKAALEVRQQYNDDRAGRQ